MQPDETSILKYFGRVLRETRKDRSLSQEELAARSGLHRTYITDIERGSRNVSLKNIERIARAVGVPLSDLFHRFEQFVDTQETFVVQRIRRSAPVEILLVEDDESFIELMLHQLERWNISNHVLICRTGIDALDMLIPKNGAPHVEVKKPKVVLLDLTLPVLDGIELLERLRANESTSSLPVVVVTSSISDSHRIRCQQLGVAEYLTKPVDMEAFAAVLGRLGFHLVLQHSGTDARP